MKLTFVTGNQHKLKEACAMLTEHDITSESYDLPEIQSLDPHEVVRRKALAAFELCRTPLFVEDVSLTCYALGRLPGTFIKFFIDDMGAAGLADLVHHYDQHSAKAQCTIGFVDQEGEVHIIKGIVNGTIVAPRGASDFGFDPIFLPERHIKTYAQMTTEEKNSISHRGVALSEFRTLLSQEK